MFKNSQWTPFGEQDHHGISIPVFSLLTEQSCGIGEYLDLIPMIKFCSSIGFDIIQILPINDTGCNSSPYDSISAFALNPLLISITQLPNIDSTPNYQDKIKQLQQYNLTQRINYDIVRELKMSLLHDYFLLSYDSIKESSDFLLFKQQNSWLIPYSVFRFLKSNSQWKSWIHWDSCFQNPSKQNLFSIFKKNINECNFYIFLQFLCFNQWKQIRIISKEYKIFIKGDLPILLSLESAEVWYRPDLFDLSVNIGAPADMYNKNGQNWGLPSYNWENLKSTNYSFFSDRLQYAQNFYDIYRLDHICGFYRLWSISKQPPYKSCFIPKKTQDCFDRCDELFSLFLASTSMLPIGEDLGDRPKLLSKLMKKHEICGTRVLRWERKYKTDKSFIPVNKYDRLSVSMVSNHDSETLQIWWKNNPKEARAYCRNKKWKYLPELSNEYHINILESSHNSNSIFHINPLQEYTSLFLDLSTPEPYLDRINIPGTVSDFNWSYRMPIRIEILTKHERIKSLMYNFCINNKIST